MPDKRVETVLVSFIGVGSYYDGEYELTEYYFDGEAAPRKTSVFGSALLKYLQDNQRDVMRWLILGTKESIWSELIKMFSDPDLSDNEEKLRGHLSVESLYSKDDGYISKISPEDVSKWQDILNQRLESPQVICRIVGDATDEKSHNAIFEALLENIETGNHVVFDVTHGLRNQPIITSFVVMYLRWLKNITEVEFYYGAKDLKGKVVKLDFCREILAAIEAVATFKHTGNYVPLGKGLNLPLTFEDDLKTLTFADEVHRPAHDLATNLLENLSHNRNQVTEVKKPIADLLEYKALRWVTDHNLPERQGQRAKFAFEHAQYFKAIALLWEAIRSAAVLKQNPNQDQMKDSIRRQATSWIKDNSNPLLSSPQKSHLVEVEDLRNAIMHGTDGLNQTVNRALTDPIKFQKIFENGVAILRTLLK